VLGRIERVQPFEREGWTGAVADETLDPGTVLTFDAHGGVDAEPARALPGEDAGGVDLVEKSVATEEGRVAGGQIPWPMCSGASSEGLAKTRSRRRPR
jgi:hypothetical protein